MPPEPPRTQLGDLQAAWGPQATTLQFVVEDGSLAGLRMAFFLRGDVLDVAFQDAGEQALSRLRECEEAVRAALASRGLELGRFDADERDTPGGRDDREAPPPTKPPRRRAGGREAVG